MTAAVKKLRTDLYRSVVSPATASAADEEAEATEKLAASYTPFDIGMCCF